MLAASRLILVSILASSWSLSDQEGTNVRPAGIPKMRLCPSASGGHAVGFPTRDVVSSAYRMGASTSLFSQGQSCRHMLSRRHHQTRAWGSGFRGRGAKHPEPMYLRQRLAKRVFVHADTLVALTPFSAQLAHDARGQILVNFKGGFHL